MKSGEGGVQCGRVAHTQDRNTSILDLYVPSIYLLPKREKCTRVYTIVYTRVHSLALSMSSVEHSRMFIPRG